MTGPLQTVSGKGTGTITSLVTAITATTAGSCLVVYASAFGDTSSPSTVTLTSGTGGTGGSFAADSWAVATSSLGSAGTDAGIWVDPNCLTGTNAVKVTTNGTGTQTIMVIIEEWPGLALTSVTDQTAAPLRQSASSGTWSVGPTGTTTQANEVVVACAASFNSTSSSFTLGTPGSPWTEETQVQDTSSYYQLLSAGYQTVSSTGTFTYNGTASYKTTACIATLLIAATANAPAGLATGTGAAQQAGGQNAGLAAGTGAAQQPSVTTSPSVNAPAGLASAAGTAQQAGGQNAGLASGTGHAQPVTAALTVASAAAVASGTGHAQPPSVSGGTAPRSADSVLATESAFYGHAGNADTGQGSESAWMAVRGTDSAHAGERSLSSWPRSSDTAGAGEKVLNAGYGSGADTGRGTEAVHPFSFTLADSAHGTDAVHEIGVWTYVQTGIHLLLPRPPDPEALREQAARHQEAVSRLTGRVPWRRVTWRAVTGADTGVYTFDSPAAPARDVAGERLAAQRAEQAAESGVLQTAAGRLAERLSWSRVTVQVRSADFSRAAEKSAVTVSVTVQEG